MPKPHHIGNRASIELAFFTILAGSLLSIVGRPGVLHAQEKTAPPHWIWFPTGKPVSQTPAETRYFRKVFHVKEPSKLALDVTADNAFTLYLDGKEVTRGDQWQTVKSVQIRVATGSHVLAAVASNEAPGPAAFLVRGGIQPVGQGDSIQTDASWKVATEAPRGDAWTIVEFDDSKWVPAADLGILGTGPWRNLVFESGDASERFQVPEGFQVSTVASASVTGSVVAFTFDENGRPCVSIERGPIARLLDEDGDGTFEGKVVIAPQMNNCQGLSFIRGHLYAVGDGPRNTGLYRLTDTNGDGIFNEGTELVRATRGGMGEHGPHAVRLGPDGSLYYNNGNHAHLAPPIDPASPVNEVFRYEGELLPHYDDPRGHAAGVMAPGGEIYRSDDDGKTWTRVAAGFRNEYDFDFNRDGEIFSFDSDMEWDLGLPWYRPVRVTHAPPGAEFGWRNGSAKWPAYYYDSLPAILDIGRGSPTGVTFYQGLPGNDFPREFDDNLLICDWSQGRILAIQLVPDGASYKASSKELVTGQPLNVTDIEVGPDGAVYFSTGGRGTLGGLFRVAWKNANHVEQNSLVGALMMPSPLSSYSQAKLARIKDQEGDRWGKRLSQLAQGAGGKVSASSRTRALDLLIQFGPQPSEDLLIRLARDVEPRVRSKAIQLLGTRTTAKAREALRASLSDPDPRARRLACEALVRSGGPIPIEELLPLLADKDRFVRYAARVAIEHGDLARYRDRILTLPETRPRLEGMLALVRATRLDPTTQNDLLRREAELLQQPLAFDDQRDLLRLIGLTYRLGPQTPASTAEIAEILRLKILADFDDLSSGLKRDLFDGPNAGVPAWVLNREMARLLAYLGEPRAVDSMLKAQVDDPDHGNQIHYAYCLRALEEGWSFESRGQFWAWFEKASHWDGGYSYLGYLDRMVQDFLPRFAPFEITAYLASATEYPFPSRVLVRSLDLNAHPELVKDLSSLYVSLGKSPVGGSVEELRALIVEKLGQAGRSEARAALRHIAAADPAHRDLIARSVALHPTAEDLPLLVESLRSRDPNTTSAVLHALTRIEVVPDGPDGLRNLILLARRSGPSLLPTVNLLASRWTQTTPPKPDNDVSTALSLWEKVYAERFPKGPALIDDTVQAGQQYTRPQLVSEVIGTGLLKQGSPERGRLILQRARCLDCHKFGDLGAGLGPDLTTVSSRFRPDEILESILEPSKVISDQYKPLTVATRDGQVFNGMPAGGDDRTLVLLLSDGSKVNIPKADIDEQAESKTSVMPAGLLNGLNLREIADLLALFEAQPRVESPKPKN